VPIFGFKELSRQLEAMSTAASGAALKRAATFAIKPAVAAAKRAAPVADPPYHVGAGVKGGVYGSGAVRTVNPYPRRTYLGRLVTPGFTQRNVASKVTLDRGKTVVHAMIGVKPEAFYALQFVELGTSKMAKRPWLEPSFRGSISEVDARFQDLLKALIDSAAKKG
jgi:HK97 gp10 family phage protein